MSAISIFFTALFYISLFVFLIGMARKIYQYWITPAPLKIPTAPTPLTQTGVVMRMAREVVLFESLFKSSSVTQIRRCERVKLYPNARKYLDFWRYISGTFDYPLGDIREGKIGIIYW